MPGPQRNAQEPKPMSGVERLTLRVSSMINHPIAQERKWATIHRLESDGDREWDEVMEGLSEVEGLQMTFNKDEGSVRLSWEAPDEEDPRVQALEEFEALEEPAPF